MAEDGVMWSRPPNIQSIDPNEKLFLFGYSCKIFRDDEKARYIDQGKHLIPWMGDDTLKIDRYDVRGYLHDLRQYEPKPGGYPEDLDSEEERLCEEERYRSLRSDLSEEQLYQEEELKRLRAAIASDGAYHEISFAYDNTVEKYEPMDHKVEEPEDEPFEAPEGLVIPKGIEIPSNMKIHTIIEKTAVFVSEQGGQMEIIIKMKQHANPQFGFMHLDNPLHPYYKHLVKEIKSGSYKPIQTKRVSRSEDEDEDGHYLHPSLLAGKKENVPQFTVPSINFRRSQDDSYAVLVRNLQQQLAEEKAMKEQIEADNSQTTEDEHLVNYSVSDTLGSDPLTSSSNVSGVIPPPDMQPIIQKMAEYVAKNGDDFEYVVKSKNDKRFDFLQPSCPYYNYYIHLRDSAKVRFAIPATTENTEVILQEQDSSPNNHASKPDEETVQNEEATIQCQNLNAHEQQTEPTMDEFDALYAQDSQDFGFAPEPVVHSDDQANSLDSVDSVGIPTNTKAKSAKVLKGPISFSLKSKEAEATPTEKTKIPLLLDDSDEDSNGENKEKVESHRKGKSTEDSKPILSSRHDSVENEEKAKLNSEQEAKLVEEQKKNKLLSAARERLVQHKKEKRLQMEQQRREEQLKKERLLQIEQQRKEKELQFERKKKAALFLKMLKKRDPEQAATIAEKFGNDKKSKSTKLWEQGNSEGILTENGILFPEPKLHMKTNDQSSSSASEESGEEIMITEFCSNPDQIPEVEPVPEKVSKPIKQERKKKKKKRSRSRSRERRTKSSKSKDRHRSRSPRNHKHEKSRKEKELPAAYAIKRSRSRSRSPRRYRQNPYWNHRR